ncbi:unnamed protein product [Closterium sp. NIES-54]
MYTAYPASASVEDDCYSCMPRVAKVEAASLGACDSASAGAEPEEALHTFTLDLGASRCFFCDSTTLTPLTAPVLVTLVDPSGGPVVVLGSTVLPCMAAPSGLLTGLHISSLAKNSVATSVLQDHWVTVTQPGGELVTTCMDSRTREHLATFTRRPGPGLYTLTSESAQVAESSQVAASVEVAVSCSCHLFTHQTLLWHHRLGHPSLPHLRGMQSLLLVSGLPRSLAPLPRSLAQPCLPCVEGWQRATPHSSLFPPVGATLRFAFGLLSQASAMDMAVEGVKDEEEEGMEAATSTEAAGVADTAATTRAMGAVAADSTASATIATRTDTCGAIATNSLMDGPLLKAKRAKEWEEGEEEAMEAVAVAEVVLQI